MSTIVVSVACIVASVLALLLKKYNADYSFIITVCTASIAFIYIMGSVAESVTTLSDLFSSANLSKTYLSVLLKCVGICIITEFSSDCCKDAGQAALSSVVVFSGRLFVIVSSLPLFKELLELVIDLSGG